MLHLVIEACEPREYYDEKNNQFLTDPGIDRIELNLEHSLLSVSKWEAKWHIPFLAAGREMTYEQNIDYIRCMCITQNVDPKVFKYLSSKNIDEINKYISDPMTASTVTDIKKSHKSETITSELIYYWMIALQIPFECQKWHINRLLMLIKICNAKSEKPKKLPKGQQLARQRDLNAARRAKLHSKG